MQLRGSGWGTAWVEKRISPLAAHDETVSGFGRNDGFSDGEKRTSNGNRRSFDFAQDDTRPPMVPHSDASRSALELGGEQGTADDGGYAGAEEFDGVREFVVGAGGDAHLEADAGDALAHDKLTHAIELLGTRVAPIIRSALLPSKL